MESMHFITAVYDMYAGFHKLSRDRDKDDVRVNYKIMSSSENSTRRPV